MEFAGCGFKMRFQNSNIKPKFQNPKFKYPLLPPLPNFKIQAEFEDDSKSKVGDLGESSNFYFWRF